MAALAAKVLAGGGAKGTVSFEQGQYTYYKSPLKSQPVTLILFYDREQATDMLRLLLTALTVVGAPTQMADQHPRRVHPYEDFVVVFGGDPFAVIGDGQHAADAALPFCPAMKDRPAIFGYRPRTGPVTGIPAVP